MMPEDSPPPPKEPFREEAEKAWKQFRGGFGWLYAACSMIGVAIAIVCLLWAGGSELLDAYQNGDAGHFHKEWGLPVEIAQTKREVHAKLGLPLPAKDGLDTIELYPQLGLSLQYDGDELMSIVVSSEGKSDLQAYQDGIVRGLKLGDSTDDAFRKLGPPQAKDNGAYARLFWKRGKYVVVGDFSRGEASRLLQVEVIASTRIRVADVSR